MLVKETATLHKVLSKYLASQTVDVSFPQIDLDGGLRPFSERLVRSASFDRETSVGGVQQDRAQVG